MSARVRTLTADLEEVRLRLVPSWSKDADGDTYTVSIFDMDDNPNSMPIAEAFADTLDLAVSEALGMLNLPPRLDPGAVVPWD
jgi:hypothetical protein